MRIGLRTIKTVITATLGIIIANQLGLMFASTAGIIAILSVTNTKKSSFILGIGRVLAFLVATLLAFISYHILGYTAVAFGLFLLLFIPIAAYAKMPEAIPVNSVLMTHFLNEKSMSQSLILNALSLLLIGIGLALLANLRMPDATKDIRSNQVIVDATIQTILHHFANLLDDKEGRVNCTLLMEGLSKSLKQGRDLAKRQIDNRLLKNERYYVDYFAMRQRQFDSLEDMYNLISEIQVDHDVSVSVTELLNKIAETFSEENNGIELKQHVLSVFQLYEVKALPTTRVEFENRAQLYQLLLEIQTFIDIKVDFSKMNVTLES